MAINCNQITQVATELKMKFESCKVLKAEHMDTLVDLIEAISDCVQNNTNFTNSQRINVEGLIQLNTSIDNQYVNLINNTIIDSIFLPEVGKTKRIHYNVITQNGTETLTIPGTVIGTFNPAVENIIYISVTNNPIDGVIINSVINN